MDYSNTLFNIADPDGFRFYYDLHEGGERYYRTGLVPQGRWENMNQLLTAINADIVKGSKPEPLMEQIDRLFFSRTHL